ncbi:Protein of unknown function [Vibrio xiamenensis]|uniref:DUF2860 domain-containing protein n=1 Tax=Vibrio xiamenensis TaxID=861298 RepID=A0A1G8FLF0_9VIBR|nr:DUF2860 domain-containing protein [Vibrio xiamenensis]SDH82917.1 Protein of unknown function [Vibrio xiamenensis]
MRKHHVGLLLCLCSSPSWAELADHGGLSGELSVLAGYAQQKSQLNTGTNPILTDFNQSASSDSKSFAAPLGNLKYTFGSSLEKQVYIGTSRDDVAVGTLAAEIGYKEAFPDGMVVDVSYLPTVLNGEAWKDPFVTGSKRHDTDVNGNAFRLKVNKLFGSVFSIDTAYTQKDVHSEHSGEYLGLSEQQQRLLGRDSTAVYIKGSAALRFPTMTFVSPSLEFIDSTADGEAMSFRSYGGELSIFQFLPQQRIGLTLGYSQRDYSANHPVFDTKRSDEQLKLFLAYEYSVTPLWSIVSFAGYNATDSNIKFYEEDSYLVALGVNFKF